MIGQVSKQEERHQTRITAYRSARVWANEDISFEIGSKVAKDEGNGEGNVVDCIILF